MSANDMQIGGSHYKDMGQQPWDVLRDWLTAEEYRGWMKGNAIVYLARERNKGSNEDLRKALHTLTKLVEVTSEKKVVTVAMLEDLVAELEQPKRKYVKKTPTKAAPFGFKKNGEPRKYKPKGWTA
jgi:hypothetical protein